jgi:DNA-binding phage protein
MAKVLVSLNDVLLRRVDRIAKVRGLSRSAYLAGLAERDLARVTGPGANPSAHRALARLDQLFRENGGEQDATEAVRAQRDAR